MDEKARLPGVENPQSLEHFCQAYLAYRDEMQKQARQLEQEAKKKRRASESAQQSAQAIPAEIRRVRAEMQAVEAQQTKLASQRAALLGETEEDAFSEEEAAECCRVQEDYERKLQALDAERRELEQSAEQSGGFLKTLRSYQQLVQAVKPYQELAENNVNMICQCFPAQAAQITAWMANPIEAVELDFESRLPERREPEHAVICRPIRTMELIDSLIAPDSCPASFWKRWELLALRCLLAAVLAVGIAAGFLVSPWCIPVGAVLAFAAAVVVTRRGNWRIDKLVPWDELRLCRFILNYSPQDAEHLARREYGLPDQNSQEYTAAHQEKLAALSKRRDEVGKLISKARNAVKQSRQSCAGLEEELQELQSRADRTNSRLGHALQKQQNGLELTANETMLINSYEEEKRTLQTQTVSAQVGLQDAQSRLRQLETELASLSVDIQRREEDYRRTHQQLSRIEAVQGDTGARLDAQEIQLRTELEQALAEVQARYNQRRQSWLAEKQQRDRDAMAKIDRKTGQSEKNLAELAEQLKALEHKQEAESAHLPSLQEESEAAARQAKRQRALADSLYTPAVWQENCSAWFQASQALLEQPADCYTIKGEAYVMGPAGPYRLDHGCHPCVLLYDAPGPEAQERRPTYYLEKTVKAIMFGLRNSNAPGLVDFAVVDEYANGGRVAESVGRCYDSQGLNQLNQLIDQWIQELRQETKGHTVSGFNQAQAKYLRDNKIVSSPQELQTQLRKTLFVFVIPHITSQNRPMNHQELWRKLRDDCGDFGFVPLLFIPKQDWDAALAGGKGGSQFDSAVRDELSTLSHVRKIEIPLN